MNMHGILSARWAEPEPDGGYADGAPVLATMLDGSIVRRRADDDICGGGMLAFLADGGGVESYAAPAIDMAVMREAAHAEAWRYGEAIVARELGNWTSAEQLSWDLQKSESQIVVDGGSLSPSALIPGLAEDKGVTLEDYALSVLQYAERFQQITRAAIQLRRAVGVLLSEELDTPEALAAAVDALKAQADGLAAELIGA
jgi:hypothetical protein